MSRRRSLAVRLALLVCGLLAGTAAQAARVYVTNERDGTLSVIDDATQRVLATLPLGKRPRGLVLAPDGRRLYVALSGSPIGGPGVDESTLPPADKDADGIGVVELAPLKLVKLLRGVSDPEQLALSADGGSLYVASEDTGQLLVLDAHSGARRAAIEVGGEPEGVAVDPKDGSVYVTSERDAQIAVVEPRQGRRAATIAVGARPRGIVFSADGARAYVSNEASASVSVIDTARRVVTRSFALGAPALRPMGLALGADGGTLYVSTGRGRKLLALDAASGETRGAVEVGPRPWGLARCASGRLYSANGPSNDVTVIDGATLAVRAHIAVGEGPWGAVCAAAD